MRLALVCAAALLAGCDREAPSAPAAFSGGGAALEQAALARGLVPDPARLDPVGAYSSDTDAVCMLSMGDDYRVGVSSDYGEGQRCRARGTARGRETLRLDLGGGCRIEARFDGRRIVFPAVVPAACDRACTGRATLSALAADQLSGSAAEAAALRDPAGRSLCAR